MIKEEFIKHGWEIQNENKLGGIVYYNAIKGNAKLGVWQKTTYAEIVCEGRFIVIYNNVKFAWECLCEGLKTIIAKKKQDEEQAIENHRKAIERYEETERMLGIC